MSLKKQINPKCLQTINFYHHNNAQQIAGSLSLKVLRIQGPNDLYHPSMRDAINLITNEEFSKNFLRAGKAFVINLLVSGSIIPLDCQQISALGVYRDRPMIFHFENTKGDFCIYFKDKKSKNLKYLSKITQISIESFFESEFSFELLLRALKSKFCGEFNGKLTETMISREPLIGDYRLIDLAVMGNDVLCVRFLQIFENCLECLDVESLRILQHAARSCDGDGFLAVFDENFECRDGGKISKSHLTTCDSSGYNLLMLACENSNINGVMFLLNLSIFDVNYSIDGVTAASLTKSPEILLMLLQNDSKYPKNFKKIHKTEELQLFTQKITELHQAIQNGDEKFAREILCNFKLRFFFNEENISAAFTSIQQKQFKIYEYLLINDSTIAPFENIEDLNLDHVSRIILKDLHEKYKSALYEKCVLDLEKKIKSINVSKNNRRKYQFELRNALNALYDIEDFRPLLQITGSSDVEITLDFERNCVNFLDPTEVKDTRGYFGNGAIYIGAKDLFDDNLKNLFLATFTHELTHFVINFLYGNQCRPYHSSDKKRENDFKKVHEMCGKKRKSEKLIETIFNYCENLQHSELIVRPNHMRALYHDNLVMWRAFEENFEELLRFYKERIFVDMVNALEWIEGDRRRGEEYESDVMWRKKRKYAEVYKEIEKIEVNCEDFEEKSTMSEKFEVMMVENHGINYKDLQNPELNLKITHNPETNLKTTQNPETNLKTTQIFKNSIKNEDNLKNCNFLTTLDSKNTKFCFCDRFEVKNQLDVEVSVPNFNEKYFELKEFNLSDFEDIKVNSNLKRENFVNSNLKNENFSLKNENSNLKNENFVNSNLKNPLDKNFPHIENQPLLTSTKTPKIHQFEVTIEDPVDPKIQRSRKISQILFFLLFLAIFIFTLIFFIFNQKFHQNPPKSERLITSNCHNLTNDLILTKNLSAIDEIKSREIWGVDSPCNLLQYAVEIHEDDSYFIEQLIEIAEDFFEDCKGEFKKLLVANKAFLNYSENVRKVVEEKLKKTLSLGEYLKFLNGNYEGIGGGC